MRSVRLLTALAALAATRAAAGPSFVVERRTDDGTRETRVHHGDLTAVDSWAQESLLLRQVSDGRRLLQAVLRDGRLSQCEMLRDAESLERFFDDFSADFECARGANGTTGCLGVRIFRDVEDLDERQQELLQWRRLARACRRLQRGEDGGGGGGRRRRRDLFLYPGTNWCGSGSSARKLNELGAHSRADRCCREHDHCPFTIEAFQRKFHLFNYRLHTLSHCECDE
ncbi:hypothetical protein V5799_030001, partial [Amblyomma americanum]